ncbi:MAG: hypothetical protein EHM55_26610, partial [Acidobacteria bacterium]
MPVSAMIRFASASTAAIWSGSRIWIVGLISRLTPLTLRPGLLYDRSTMNARIHADRSATPDLRTEEDFSLPGWTYWDPEFFELERQVVFRKSWHLVCHVNDLRECGDYLTFRFLNESILTVRGADGRVRSFHNICRHRAARLVDGEQGNCGKRITCP